MPPSPSTSTTFGWPQRAAAAAASSTASSPARPTNTPPSAATAAGSNLRSEKVNARLLVVGREPEWVAIRSPGPHTLTEGRAATPDTSGCRNAFVGGGNSAGQAAMHLARWAYQVTVLARGESLTDSMSDYLIREINAAPNADVSYGVEVVDGTGTDHPETLVPEERTSGTRPNVPADTLFVLIGSQPRAEWLGDRSMFSYIGVPLPRRPHQLELLGAADRHHLRVSRCGGGVQVRSHHISLASARHRRVALRLMIGSFWRTRPTYR